MKRQKMVYSNLECEECGNVFKIPRKRGKMREQGHTKHMYCPKCKETTAHKENYKDKQEDFWEKWHSQFED